MLFIISINLFYHLNLMPCKNLMHAYFVNHKLGLNDVWRVDVDWPYHTNPLLLYYSVDILYVHTWPTKNQQIAIGCVMICSDH